MNDELVHEVPKPLSHWYGNVKLDEENEALLNRVTVLRRLKTAPKWAFWAKNELRAYEKLLAKLNRELQQNGVNQMLALVSELKEEENAIRAEAYNTKQEFSRATEPEDCNRLQLQMKQIRHNMQGVQSDRKALLKKLKPYREMLQSRDETAARIQEHYAAIAEANEERLRTRDMDKESRLIAERIILALNQLGYYHRKTKRDMFGKVIELKEMVRFERIVTTPDKVMLKVDVSRLGLLGGHIDNLPYGIYAQDLVDERVLTHLQTALELPISSPNLERETDWYKGVWYVVDRLGIPDGLEKKVSYQTVMKRYPEANREEMPIPMGVRSGRRINWIYFTKTAHAMINGTTGFGKSNAFQMMLATLVCKHSPDEVRLIIADMKDSGDFRAFVDLPHVLGFLTELEKAEEMITSLWLEMRRRQSIIRKVTNDLNKYNDLVQPEDRLPHIYFFFDEYPSIKVNPKLAKVVNLYTTLIAMQGRSSGIHLVVSGQQSYSEDFPRTLAANITAKFTARQTSVSGAIGTTGNREPMRIKEIPGRFLYVSTTKPFQVQMPYISDEEIAAAAEDAKRWPEPRPFALPEVTREEDEDGGDLSALVQSPEELVLEAAFTKFEGALKADLIWQALDKTIPIVKVREIVKSLSSEESIEYEGKQYQPIKERKFIRLTEIENPSEELEEIV